MSSPARVTLFVETRTSRLDIRAIIKDCGHPELSEGSLLAHESRSFAVPRVAKVGACVLQSFKASHKSLAEYGKAPENSELCKPPHQRGNSRVTLYFQLPVSPLSAITVICTSYVPFSTGVPLAPHL